MSTELSQPKPEHVTDHEALLKLEGEMLEDWARLPVAHQAAMLVLLVEHMKTEENGEWWLEGVLREFVSGPEHRLAAPFQITSITRLDVAQRLGLEDAADLSDQDMRRLAASMEDAYVDRDFWQSLEYFASRLREEKKHKPENPDGDA